MDNVDYIFTDREGVEIGKEGGEYISIVDIEGEIYGIYIERVYVQCERESVLVDDARPRDSRRVTRRCVCVRACVYTYTYVCIRSHSRSKISAGRKTTKSSQRQDGMGGLVRT